MIVSATAEHFPRLHDIQLECIRGLKDTYSAEERRRWAEYIQNETPTKYTKYANLGYSDDKGIIQAFISWTVEGDDASIECLYVRESYRNEGVGKLLLEEVESKLAGKLVHIRSTLNAQSFYEKAGYAFKVAAVSRAGFAISCLEKQL